MDIDEMKMQNGGEVMLIICATILLTALVAGAAACLYKEFKMSSSDIKEYRENSSKIINNLFTW